MIIWYLQRNATKQVPPSTANYLCMIVPTCGGMIVPTCGSMIVPVCGGMIVPACGGMIVPMCGMIVPTCVGMIVPMCWYDCAYVCWYDCAYVCWYDCAYVCWYDCAYMWWYDCGIFDISVFNICMPSHSLVVLYMHAKAYCACMIVYVKPLGWFVGLCMSSHLMSLWLRV